MKENLLILVPMAAAALAAVWRGDRTRPWLLPITAAVHTVLSFWLLFDPPVVSDKAWLGFDPLARAMLPAVSLLFLCCAAYSVKYLAVRTERPNRVFVACLLAVLGLLSAGHQARHLGLLWIATEGVTLAAVPLLHFNGTPRAFEATWKYLLVGGTGIGYFVWNEWNNLALPNVIFAVVMIGLVGMLLDQLFGVLQKLVTYRE